MAVTIAPISLEYGDVAAPTLSMVIGLLDPEEAGTATWAIFPEYRGVDRRGRVTGVNVRLEFTIRMPRWIGRDEATAAEQTEWDRFYAALDDHEQGHVRRVRTGVATMHERLHTVLEMDFYTVLDEENERIDRENRAYDAATDHGRNPPPGTVITAPARPASPGGAP